jgi:hypothetical protein
MVIPLPANESINALPDEAAAVCLLWEIVQENHFRTLKIWLIFRPITIYVTNIL